MSWRNDEINWGGTSAPELSKDGKLAVARELKAQSDKAAQTKSEAVKSLAHASKLEEMDWNTFDRVLESKHGELVWRRLFSDESIRFVVEYENDICEDVCFLNSQEASNWVDQQEW